MLNARLFLISAALGTAIAAGPALAEEPVVGKASYERNCAACHGATGAGDGLVTELFQQKPKNLALLAKENGGVFPFDRVYQYIDGRAATKGHGPTNMPIWGDYFMVESLNNPNLDPQNAKAIVEGRILAVVYYLQTLQAK